jgi:hypothetical protein
LRGVWGHVGLQGGTGQDRTAQDSTGHAKTAQDRTGQDRTEQDNTGQNRKGQDRTRANGRTDGRTKNTFLEFMKYYVIHECCSTKKSSGLSPAPPHVKLLKKHDAEKHDAKNTMEKTRWKLLPKETQF